LIGVDLEGRGDIDNCCGCTVGRRQVMFGDLNPIQPIFIATTLHLSGTNVGVYGVSGGSKYIKMHTFERRNSNIFWKECLLTPFWRSYALQRPHQTSYLNPLLPNCYLWLYTTELTMSPIYL